MEEHMVQPFLMTRRHALAATAITPLALASAARAQSGAKPNIVFIMADDLGYADLSCYGRREYETPNIDRIAAEGMRFLQAYANSAVCSATRTALITGRYQYRLPIGLEEPLNDRNDRLGLPPAHPTLPSLLKKVGYGTTLVGKWHLGQLPNYGPEKSGYDHFWGFRTSSMDYFTHKNTIGVADLWDDDERIEPAGYLTDLLGARAVDVINDYARSGAPFFMSLHFNAPHWPWEGPGDEVESRRVGDLFHYDGGSMKTYAEMVTSMDLQVGRVLEALEANGIADNTIVVFTSDNGGERFSDTWPFSGKKTELLEGGLRIPAVVRWPRRVPAGSSTEQPATTMDWLPTLVEAGGGEPDTAYPPDGISLLPMLTENAPPVPRTIFWRYEVNSQRAVRDGDMKFLKIRDNTFLFNVVDDPLERANLRERLPDVYQRLVNRFEEWNATMLPEDPKETRGGNSARRWADHIGNDPQ
jgi:arylsulfatase A-like enzyme